MTTPDPTARTLLHDDALLAEARRVLGPGATLQLVDPPATTLPGPNPRHVAGDVGPDSVYLVPADYHGTYHMHVGAACGAGETVAAALANTERLAGYSADSARALYRRLRRLAARVAPEPAL
jgi:hypothetical protein